MKVNLNKPTGNSSPGAPAAKNEIIVVEADNLIFPGSDESGVVLEGNFVLPLGENMVTLYSTKSKTEAPMETEGDEDALSFKSSFKAQHPGNKTEVKKFVQFWTGKNVVILHKACGDDFYEVMGTPCAPLQLKSTKTDNNDGRFWNLNFEPFAKSGFVPKEYRGALVFAEPFAVSDVTALPLLVANGYHYDIPALAVAANIAVDGITLEHGKTVTLMGNGGANPAVLQNGTSGDVEVLLKNGASWTALRKSLINLRVFKDGTNTYLIELSRE